jgi:predicted aconitase
MKLEPEQESLLRGESGKGLAQAMKTLVVYGDAFGAKRLVPVKSAHLAGSWGAITFKAYIEVLGRLVSEGLKVKTPTTVNPRSGRNLHFFNRIIFGKQERVEEYLAALGVTPNYSCVCYDSANVPEFGDRLAWAESSAVQFANSVIGARTNRNSILIDLCSALTGFTPEFGYLLDENRRGKMLVKITVDKMDAAALGFLLGQKVVNKVPVIEHYDFSRVELKNMGGAMAAAGAVALFHVEGVTPEAPDMKTAFGGEPETTIIITQKDLDDLRTGQVDRADMVVFGCPQMTYEETVSLAEHFVGKKIARPTHFCMIPEAKERFEKTDLGAKVKEAGVEIYDHCPVAALTFRVGKKHVLTPSGKAFYYLAGADYGTYDDCLKACGVKS